MRTRVIVLATLLLGTSLAQAQGLRFIRRTGGFGSIGVGGGNVKIDCGGPCALGSNGTSNAELILGYHFNRRLRLELGYAFQNSREDFSATVAGFTAGLGYYPIAGLRIGAGATFLKGDGTETGIDYSTAKGTGFIVGASYDLHVFTLLDRSWSLMPYVNYSRASMSSITNTTNQTTLSGTGTAMRFGLALQGSAGRWECTPRGGAPVRLTRRTRVPFVGCLRELGRQVDPNGRIKL